MLTTFISLSTTLCFVITFSRHSWRGFGEVSSRLLPELLVLLPQLPDELVHRVLVDHGLVLDLLGSIGVTARAFDESVRSLMEKFSSGEFELNRFLSLYLIVLNCF